MRAGRRSSRASRDLRYPARHHLRYESPVSFARCSLRLEPKRRRPAIDLAFGRDPAAAGGPHGAAGFLRHPYREHADRDRASQFADRFQVAGFGIAAGARPHRTEPVMGKHPRRRVRSLQSRPFFAGRLCLCEFAGAGAGTGHRLCRGKFPAGQGILTGAVDLMHRIRREFKYDPKATVISTPLKEVFEKRHGVCQDFAHVMIAGLRGLGLPAAMSAAICAPTRRPANRACRAPTPPMPGFRCGAAPRSAGSGSIRPMTS